MNDPELYPRAKRPPQGVWRWPSRIYVPCPAKVKLDFMRVARVNGMSQAELGLVILQDSMGNEEATQRVIDAYRRDGKRYDRNGSER